MDALELQKQLLAAREFSHPVDGVTWQLRLPTDYELRRLGADLESSTPEGRLAEVMRDVTLCAVFGWDGVSVGDLLPDAAQPGDPAPFSAGLAREYLEARPGLIDQLGLELFRRLNARRQEREAAAKNS